MKVKKPPIESSLESCGIRNNKFDMWCNLMKSNRECNFCSKKDLDKELHNPKAKVPTKLVAKNKWVLVRELHKHKYTQILG